MNLWWIFILLELSGKYCHAQSLAKSILFIDTTLDRKRYSDLFFRILNRREFVNMPKSQIQPLFLNNLKNPPNSSVLSRQFSIIQNKTIFVEIGPEQFYGVSFFARQTETIRPDINRSRLIGFDLTLQMQNNILESALCHIRNPTDLLYLAYVVDSKGDATDPFERKNYLQFLKNSVGQFHIYRVGDYENTEDLLNAILLDKVDIIILNVDQTTALRVLEQADDKGILQQPFKWLVFNAGITLSNRSFDLLNSNFYAIELSTNGDLDEYPELKTIPKPIVPQDLIFWDTAVLGINKLAELLGVKVENVPLITSEIWPSESETLNQTWQFYSYIKTTFNQQSLYKVSLDSNGKLEASFQPLRAPPSRDALLKSMRSRPFRVGTFIIPPVVNEVKRRDGKVELTGPDIDLTRELFRRFNVDCNITVLKYDIGTRKDRKWTGAFKLLQEREIDMLVGPFSHTVNRSEDFQPTPPLRSISYQFMYQRPHLEGVQQIFQFMVAFDVYTWLTIFLAALICGGALSVLQMISPNDLFYTVHVAMLFTYGYLVQGVRTRPPTRISSQILVVVWWFFCLILVIAFCVNYAAYRSYTALITLPTSVESLLRQEYYRYGYVLNSNTETMIKDSLNPSVFSLYESIMTKFKDCLPENDAMGYERVTKGHYALIHESPFIEYYSKKYCLETSDPLWYGFYVYYLAKRLPYQELILEELARMESDGTIGRIIKSSSDAELDKLPIYCGASLNDQALEAMRDPLINWSDYSIELASSLGVFLISVIGLIVVAILLTIEKLIGVYKDEPETEVITRGGRKKRTEK